MCSIIVKPKKIFGVSLKNSVAQGKISIFPAEGKFCLWMMTIS